MWHVMYWSLLCSFRIIPTMRSCCYCALPQKKTTPIFTKNGFEKTRAPPMLYAMLKVLPPPPVCVHRDSGQ